jgi:CRP/FNR family transcriptional regulator, cyclic AMP receptor protein
LVPVTTHLAFLRTVNLFNEFSEADLSALDRQLRERRFRKGQIICRAGDTGDDMFLIRSGNILVSKPVTGRVEQVLARMGPGEFFGEMSLLDQSPRSATVQSEDDCLLLSLDRQNLRQLVEMRPRAAAAFYRAMLGVFIQRLRESGDQIAEVTRWGLEATGLDFETR